MAKVFISYSRKNIEFAKKLTGELQKSDLDFWVDWEGIPPTVDWWREIEKGIEETDAFLFLISPDSSASKVCGLEIDCAVKNAKRIIPIVVQDVSGDAVPKQLSHLNWIFFREQDDFGAAIQKLLTAIHTDYEWVQAHRRLQVKALEWERNNKENGFLLRGVDLQDAETRLKQSPKSPSMTNLQIEYILASRQNQELEIQKEIEAQKQRVTARRRIIMLGVLIFLVFVNTGLSYFSGANAKSQIDITGNVRVPAALLASRAQVNLQEMLRDVQNYLVLGNVEARAKYARDSLAFESDLKQLEAQSPNLDQTDQQRVNDLRAAYEEWQPLPDQLFELRDDRFAREPAYNIFMTDGREASGMVLVSAFQLREEFTQAEPTEENMARSADLAEFIASFQSVEASLGSYVDSRSRNFRQEYEMNLEDNQASYERLLSHRNQLSTSQQELIAILTENHEKFLKLADEIFRKTDSDQWRMDLYLFSTQAVPTSEKMKGTLGDINTSQQTTLKQEMSNGQLSLGTNNQLTLGAGIFALILGFGMVLIDLLGSKLNLQLLGKRVFWVLPAAVSVVIILVAINSLSATSTVAPQDPVTATEPAATPRENWDTLTLLYSQTPQTLNPHLSYFSGDLDACRITYEPLASINQAGDFIPILADEIPSVENGDLAADHTQVIWRLKSGVKWSDGEPFTADDVVFTYEFITNPKMDYSPSQVYYRAVKKVEAVDDLTVKVTFFEPVPVWYEPFVGVNGMILPRHIFEAHKGSTPQENPANFLPVGTGPYRVKEPGIQPQGTMRLGTQLIQTNKIVYEPNPYYREADKLHFSKVELLGGSITKEVARSVLQLGYADFAWNMVLDGETLARLEEGGHGKALPLYKNWVEFLYLNMTDPNTPSASGEYSSRENPHPILSDKRVRQAIAYAINRKEIAKIYAEIYGPNQVLTSNVLVAPPIYMSPNTKDVYDLAKAKDLLDEAGWKDNDADGFRDKDGVKLKFMITSFASDLAQQKQVYIRNSLQAIGVDVELKIVDAGIMFGDDTSNPDNVGRFNSDMMTFSTSGQKFDPADYLGYWTCDQIPQQANDWRAGNNLPRWCNPEYDTLYEKATAELDPEKRSELFIQLNDIIVNDFAVIPLIQRPEIHGVSNTLEGVELTPWDANTWQIQDWWRKSP